MADHSHAQLAKRLVSDAHCCQDCRCRRANVLVGHSLGALHKRESGVGGPGN